jgi:site-specific DNA-methyltransferase (adenine-specific)
MLPSRNTLYYGDNLSVLRDHIPTASVDLVYLDPPFNSQRNYNILFKDEHGLEADAQIQAFEDSWHWNDAAAQIYHELASDGPVHVGQLVGALRYLLGTNQMLAYLVMMAARLVELHRVLKPTGSLYLHCDPTASHYLKIILDSVFGPGQFKSEISWKRYGAHNDANGYGAVHDVLLYYTKGSQYIFNKQFQPYDESYIAERFRFQDSDGRRWSEQNLASPNPRPNLTYPFSASNGITYQPPANGWKYTRERMEQLDRARRLHFPKRAEGRMRLKNYMDEMPGVPVQDIWTDISIIGGTSSERLGYPTQKPLALLERIIQASSNPGDVIPEKLGRRWIGIDVTHLAISVMKSRMLEMFPGIAFQTIGEPQDIGAARKLALDDRYQFQWWALSLVKARPLGGQEGSKQGKKGADRGIDGIIPFFDDPSERPKRALIQVKSGHVRSGDVRDLRGTMEREQAPLGAFLTLEPPSREMLTEAAAAGVYRSPGWGRDYPKLQILTIEDLLRGRTTVKMPQAYAPFKQAQRLGEQGEQQRFPM